jgi:uncharacterized protein (UPF0262 family)
MARSPRKAQAGRLAAVTLDEASLASSSDDVEHERRVAIYDLIEENSFRPVDHDGGPYALHLGMRGDRLVFDIRLTDGTPVIAHMLSLAPFRRIVKDYFTVCDSYYSAIRTAMERLKRKVDVDFGTARRLFTLITVLHWKG